MSQPSSAVPFPAPPQQIAESVATTSAAFQIVKWVMTGDGDAINDKIDQIHAESGVAGLFKLVHALAQMALIIRTDLRRRLPEAAARLPVEGPRAVLENMLLFEDRHGQRRSLDDIDVDAFALGLLFMSDCASGDRQAVVDRFWHTAEREETGETTGIGDLFAGVMMLLTAALHSMPQQQLEGLMKFQPESDPPPDASGPFPGAPAGPGGSGGSGGPVPDPVFESAPAAADPAGSTGSGIFSGALAAFTIPSELKDKMLAAARQPDSKRAVHACNTLIVPLVLLHGEAALLAVCQVFAAALADLFDLPTNHHPGAPHIVISQFVDERSGAAVGLDDVTDTVRYCQMLACYFLVAFVNADVDLQHALMRRDNDNGAMLCNGLAALYRRHHEEKQRRKDQEGKPAVPSVPSAPSAMSAVSGQPDTKTN